MLRLQSYASAPGQLCRFEPCEYECLFKKVKINKVDCGPGKPHNKEKMWLVVFTYFQVPPRAAWALWSVLEWFPLQWCLSAPATALIMQGMDNFNLELECLKSFYSYIWISCPSKPGFLTSMLRLDFFNLRVQMAWVWVWPKPSGGSLF